MPPLSSIFSSQLLTSTPLSSFRKIRHIWKLLPLYLYNQPPLNLATSQFKPLSSPTPHLVVISCSRSIFTSYRCSFMDVSCSWFSWYQTLFLRKTSLGCWLLKFWRDEHCWGKEEREHKVYDMLEYMNK